MRTIFYYQTFAKGPTLDVTPYCTHVHLAAIHFGLEPDGQPYIHLNNDYPDAPCFDDVWQQMGALQRTQGVKIVLMIGGAGGGFSALFANYDPCYALLLDTIRRHNLDGVDLDMEEPVTLAQATRLIADLRRDCPGLLVAMAPLAGSLSADTAGMAGFVYADLVRALGKQGLCVDYFCAQCYDAWSTDAYDGMVRNGYGPANLVLGQLGPSGTSATAPVAAALRAKYGAQFGGVDTWEYLDTAPSPQAWAQAMHAPST